jgi:hypothetical protein
VLQTNIGFQKALDRALTEGATTALATAAQRYAGGQQTLAANQAIAEAAQHGAAAEREAQQVAAASAQTQDALNQARAAGNQTLIDAAQRLQDETLAQIKANEAAQESARLSEGTRDIRDQTAVLQLVLSLQGQTGDEIAKQVALLQTKQAIEKSLVPLASDEAQARLAAVAAQQDFNAALNASRRSQQALEDGIRGIADTIDNSIGQSIQDAFDNKKTLDWGQTIKGVLAQIANQIAQIALIRPAIGEPLGLLGWGEFAECGEPE